MKRQPFYNAQWFLKLAFVMAGIGIIAGLFFLVKLISWIIFLIK